VNRLNQKPRPLDYSKKLQSKDEVKNIAYPRGATFVYEGITAINFISSHHWTCLITAKQRSGISSRKPFLACA